MSLHIKRAKTVIASVVVVFIVVLSILVYDWEKPEVSVVNGSSSLFYTGEVRSSFYNDSLNLAWANATISQPALPNSTFYLHVGPGSIDREWNDNYGEWSCVERLLINFGGAIDADLHPGSVTFSIGTNGTNGNCTVAMQTVTSHGHNVSFSESKAFQLSFFGNGTATSNFRLLKVPFSPFSPLNHFYKFNFTTEFIITSSFEKSFDRSVNINVTLNGLSRTVTDSVSIQVIHG